MPSCYMSEEAGRIGFRELEAVEGKVKVMLCVTGIEVQCPGQVNDIWSNWPV